MPPDGYGSTIRLGREAAGLTHERLGALLGVGADAVDRWEWEEAVPPDDQLERLSEILGVHSSRLAPREVVVEIVRPASPAAEPSDPFDDGDRAVAIHADARRPGIRRQFGDAWSSLGRLLRRRAGQAAAGTTASRTERGKAAGPSGSGRLVDPARGALSERSGGAIRPVSTVPLRSGEPPAAASDAPSSPATDRHSDARMGQQTSTLPPEPDGVAAEAAQGRPQWLVYVITPSSS